MWRLVETTKICIASGTRSQALNVLEKIMLELKPNSPELANEINEKESRINGTDAKIVFKNTSYIKVVTASDSSRGNESRLKGFLYEEMDRRRNISSTRTVSEVW